jgi:hypothetical protein
VFTETGEICVFNPDRGRVIWDVVPLHRSGARDTEPRRRIFNVHVAVCRSREVSVAEAIVINDSAAGGI